MVLCILNARTLTLGFRPLTGIVPDCVLTETMDGLFSPPYGDGTTDGKEKQVTIMFSPPYGENPLSHGLRRASSPERGSLVQGNGSCKSSPFRGSWRAAPERVLRGEVEVWYKDFDGMAKKFLPPYGDGIANDALPKSSFTFSPPWGDCTMYTTAELFIMAFSPPYGDGTSMRELVARTGLFSPPYGDGTDYSSNDIEMD